jgi:hypothetical protein
MFDHGNDPDLPCLGIPNIVWGRTVDAVESSGLARVWINEVRISEVLMYQQKMTRNIHGVRNIYA